MTAYFNTKKEAEVEILLKGEDKDPVKSKSNQFGFRKGRSTKDTVCTIQKSAQLTVSRITLQQLQELLPRQVCNNAMSNRKAFEKSNTNENIIAATIIIRENSRMEIETKTAHAVQL